MADVNREELKEAIKKTGFCVNKLSLNDEIILDISANEVLFLINNLYISSHRDPVCLIQPNVLCKLFAFPSSSLYAVNDTDSDKHVEFSSDLLSGDKSIYLGPYNFTTNNIKNTVLSFGDGLGITISELAYGDEEKSILVYSSATMDFEPDINSGGVLGSYSKMTKIYSPNDSLTISEILNARDVRVRDSYRADLFESLHTVKPSFTNGTEIQKLWLSKAKQNVRLVRSILLVNEDPPKTLSFPADKSLSKLGERATNPITAKMVKSLS